MKNGHLKFYLGIVLNLVDNRYCNNAEMCNRDKNSAITTINTNST